MIREANFDQLDAATLYSLLQLRTDVFVVEQRCAYPELDGRDTEQGTRHVWITAGGGDEAAGGGDEAAGGGDDEADGAAIAAYLRVLVDREAPRTLRVGRVVTHAEHRGEGLAARLMQRVLTYEFDELVLDAQSHLVGWYERLGFSTNGTEYLEDGIPHVAMRLSLPAV